MTRPCLSVLTTSHSWCSAREDAEILDSQNRLLLILPALLRQLLATMEKITSAFPLSTLSHNSVQLDSIIFYSGPPAAKTREITPIHTDE